MRVGVDITSLAKGRAGIAQYVYYLIRELDHLGVELVLFGPKNILFDLNELKNADIKLFGTWKSGSSSLIYLIKFFNEIKQADVDVFWGPSNFLLGCNKNTLKIVTIHDLVFAKHPETMRLLSALFYKFSIPRSILKADIIVVPSYAVQSELETYASLSPKKIEIVSPASRFPILNDCGGYKHLLFVGSLEPRKNIERILLAYSMLATNLKREFPLILCGRESWKLGNARAIINEFGNTENIHILEDIDDKDLEKLYSDAACVLLPSIYEGFGMPIIEANSFGKTVITSNFGSMLEVAGSAAILIDPYDVKDISRAMQRVLTEKFDGQLAKNSAHTNALRYSWNRSAKDLLDLIETRFVK